MAIAAEFEAFWQAFPRKVGKLAAQKAYLKARKDGATQAQLLDGIADYLRCKPHYADFCYPATWLNQGRWLDEWHAPPPQERAVSPNASLVWLEECRREHGGACGASLSRHQERMAAKATA